MNIYRLHGDNIVECERIAELIIKYSKPTSIERGFSSLACPFVIVHPTIPKNNDFKLEFFPGFNKSHNDRWSSNILDLLTAEGCFLDETPDIILTEVLDKSEKIIAAIEFCSALQAGNQAWQRSGRAYSVGRTKCPYIYILDFVKYELDSTTRGRKALRFPNPAVVYSYISHSLHTNNLVTQAYVKAEEFQPDFDSSLKNFTTDIFGEKEIAEFLLYKMAHLDSSSLEKKLLEKNAKMVELLSDNKNGAFTKTDWEKVLLDHISILEYSKQKKLGYKKKIAEKSLFGHVEKFRDICSKYAIGIASTDLPFGLIPATNKEAFGKEIIELYSISDEKTCNLLLAEEDLLICILKGFKPKGDDNRPDRGALPFALMLLNEEIKVLSFLFGPIVKTNVTKLRENYESLYHNNGLWRSIIGISDLIIVDSPCVDSDGNLEIAIYNTELKKKILNEHKKTGGMLVSPVPNKLQENDVDAVIHYLFKYSLSSHVFEGMCNPPGGDWSGLSVVMNGKEYRWLSLPRVSPNGKRPDHVIELFNVTKSPVLIVIESKEKIKDLEPDIGISLKHYLNHLFSFKPSVVRESLEKDWSIATSRCNISNITIVSAGAFLKTDDFDKNAIFNETKCDLLFALHTDNESNKWIVEIYYKDEFKYLANFIRDGVKNLNEMSIVLR
ncbi:MAG: hypothetical protein ACI4M0_00395 [Christensenellales bacterium]